MEKEFIPYEQALDLKELGFDELCICIYNREKSLRVNVFNNPNDRFKSVQLSYNNGKIPAPLYQQAFRWFREKHNLEASIQRMPPEVYGKGKGDIKNYLLYIWAKNLNPRGQQTLHFDTYEEAEFECLKKLIEIAKEQNVK